MNFSTITLLSSLFFMQIARANASTCDLFFAKQNLCASLQWLTIPSASANGSFRLEFFSKIQESADPIVLVAPNAASVGVKLNMPGMGHGGGLIKVRPTTNASGNRILGEFDATEVYFTMSGAWQIQVQLKDQDGVTLDSAQLDYNAP